MRYSDTQLWKLSKEELDILKASLSFNDFCKWSANRLTELINDSVNQPNWMDAEVSHLRNYRIKARDKFFIPKIIDKRGG